MYSPRQKNSPRKKKESIFVHLVISAGHKRYKTANLKKIRRHYEQDSLRQQIIPDESNRFRYFYQLRRANGDALSSVNFEVFFLILSSNRSLNDLICQHR